MTALGGRVAARTRRARPAAVAMAIMATAALCAAVVVAGPRDLLVATLVLVNGATACFAHAAWRARAATVKVRRAAKVEIGRQRATGALQRTVHAGSLTNHAQALALSAVLEGTAEQVAALRRAMTLADTLDTAPVSSDVPGTLGPAESREWLEHHFPERTYLDSVVRRGVDALEHDSSLLAGHPDVRARPSSVANADLPGRSFVRAIDLGRTVKSATGFAVVYRVHGWQSIRYLAVGYQGTDGVFRHVKVRHPRQGRWDTLAVDVSDLAYQLEQGWEAGTAEAVRVVQVRVSGTDTDGQGSVDVAWATAWRAPGELRLTPAARRRSALGATASALCDYVVRTHPNYRADAELFMRERQLTLAGPGTYPWAPGDTKPVGPQDDATSRYLWHGLSPAIGLFAYGLTTGSAEARAAGHELVRTWLDESYVSVDDDQRYAWYDHASAERLIAFVLAQHDASEHGGEAYAQTLADAMRRHALLLESESFYVRNQNYRYHNHALFQDLALLAAGLVTDVASADRLVQRALVRLEDQMSSLVAHEQGLAVLVENSIGYHHAIEHLLECAGVLTELADGDRQASETAAAMRRFSDIFRYADGRLPAVGDTWRSVDVPTTERQPPIAPGLVVLPRTGYVAGHGADGTSLFVFATSLSATHKHCDNLSLTLYSQGVEWLVDPSFFSHAYTEPIPAYLRGPFAHTGIALSGVAYSTAPGKAHIEASGDHRKLTITGSHTAYDGYRIEREVMGSVDPLDLTVRDRVDGLGSDASPQAVAVVHLGEGVVARLGHADGRSVSLTHRDAAQGLVLTWDRGAPTLVTGWNAEHPEHSSVAGSTFGVSADTTSILVTMPADGVNTWSVRSA